MKLEIATTTCLAMDFQHGILAMSDKRKEVIPFAARAVKAARAKGIRVFHVGVGFSPDYVEVSSDNKRFSMIRDSGAMVRGTEQTDVHPEIFKEGETRIWKYRISAFAGSKLDVILRAQNSKTLVLFGVATSGVVLSTLRQASDLDFKIIVIKDACHDPDAEVHKVLTEKIFPSQATVMTVEEFEKLS